MRRYINKKTQKELLEKYNIKDINNIPKRIPTKEELENLYIHEALSSFKIAWICGYKSENKILELLKKYNISKSKTQLQYQMQKARNQTNLERYGVENVSQNIDIKNKLKIISTKNSKERFEKIRKTIIERYGVENVLQNNDIKNKIRKTNLERYGVEWTLQNKDIKCKATKTIIERYGVENVSQSEEIHNKKIKTMIKNNSFKKSKAEEEIYNCLLCKFKNVIRQYKSIYYNYHCDFYISEKDLYIEYQGWWGHGKEPYNKDNIKHQEIIKHWSYKHSPQYISAINVWTHRDVEKRNIAKNNNLNWLEFFSLNEFYKWFNNQ